MTDNQPYPKWFPDDNSQAKAVDYHRTTVNIPYISLLSIILIGVLSPFLFVLIVHPLIDFIVGSILYTIAFLIALRLAWRFMGRIPITIAIKKDTIEVKYLFKKKEIRPDNIMWVTYLDRKDNHPLIKINLSTSKKPIYFNPEDFKENTLVIKNIIRIARKANLPMDERILKYVKKKTIK